MENKTKWRWPLIFSVILLTFYNILPTLFYYSQPLKEPLKEKKAQKIVQELAARADLLQKDSLDWLASYCRLLQINPIAIKTDLKVPHVIDIQLSKKEDAERIRTYLPRSGALIPFVPAQLTLLPNTDQENTVTLLRKTAIRFPDGVEKIFSFTQRNAPLYVDLIVDRAALVASSVAGESELSRILLKIDQHPASAEEFLLSLSAQINEIADLFEKNPEIRDRFFANLTLGSFADRSATIDRLVSALETCRDRLKLQKANTEFAKIIEQKETSLARAGVLLKRYRIQFSEGKEPLSYETARIALARTASPSTQPIQNFDLYSLSPLFRSLEIDWDQATVSLQLQEDLLFLRQTFTKDRKERLEQLLINEAARISQRSGETLIPKNFGFSFELHQLQDVKGLIVCNLDLLIEQMQEDLLHLIKREWRPSHPDLSSDHFPIVDSKTFLFLPELQKKLCLLMEGSPQQFSISTRGLDRIFSSANHQSEESQQQLKEDLHSLVALLQTIGFRASNNATGELHFEWTDPFKYSLHAFREEFFVKGSKRFAFIECSDLAQRILVENRIDTRIHEDLLKWQDEYHSSLVSLDPRTRYDVPKPTKSPFWNNIFLSFKKLWRGDERKILRWGLDLSGGKTVQIELRDQNGRVVTDEHDLKQGINELFARVNKMGVSDVSIRQLGNTIVLDFPSSQALSAKELVTASSMSFHVVNEVFSLTNRDLADSVNRFLQEVWNEALITNRKDSESINLIAWNRLYGTSSSESARILKEQGLRLADPKNPRSTDLDETYSKIVLFRGSSPQEWQNQTHPLLFVFKNHALEGSHLTNIHSSYDPSKGNFLSFDVKPGARDILYRWTSLFSKEQRGQGARMAVILNDSVISAPVLSSALRESAMITGNFSQREVQKLASDLKAGSLTFTPVILSEKNVSPELGASDRASGILAMGVSLLFIFISMIGYYRFAGVVASVAVLFNLLILWATLQNMQATLSLAGIAGIILTVAMAIDANVLVFERMKEELEISKSLSFALDVGYKKAFSAILDSNVTTLLAALILLNFDAGPIKGFAITLIIGIVSSLFTALFMTRTYFSWWAKRNAKKTISMSHWVRSSSFNFLKQTRVAFGVTSLVILIGGALFFAQRNSIFGMDFTGGFSATFELQRNSDPNFNYAASVETALIKEGVSSRDVQVRTLTPSHHLRVLLSTHNDLGSSEKMQKWMHSALEKNALFLTKESASSFDQNWIAMSGQMSDAMRNNALLGLFLAFISIYFYLMFRFETAFAMASLACLGIELLLTLGCIAILHACGIGIQIDLNTIAALMTIIGYCLNDIIIIFDRIREELSSTRGNRSFVRMINDALNATLGRTAITSGTTFFILLILVLLGGPTLLSFAAVMAIGVFIGTISSWFIACPLLLRFSQKSERITVSD